MGGLVLNGRALYSSGLGCYDLFSPGAYRDMTICLLGMGIFSGEMSGAVKVLHPDPSATYRDATTGTVTRIVECRWCSKIFSIEVEAMARND